MVEGLIVRITTSVLIVVAVLVGMSLATTITPGADDIGDVLGGFVFDIEVPALSLGGQATGIFTREHASPVGSSCEETDSGNDPYVFGFVKLESAQGAQEFQDTCREDALVEYYCDGMQMHNYTRLCVYGCWQGVCRNAPAKTASDEASSTQPVDQTDMRAVHEALAPRWIEPATTAACKNGFRDGKETDADCGGPCRPCLYSQMCKTDADCEAGLVCNYRSKRCLRTKY